LTPPDQLVPSTIEQSRESNLSSIQATRLYFFVPLAAAVTVAAFLDPAPWRGPLVLLDLIAFAGLLVHNARLRRSGRPMRANLATAIVFQTVLLFATGGLDSPLLGFTAALATLIGGRVGSPGLVALQLATIWAAALAQTRGFPPDVVPSVFGGKEHGHSPALLLATAGGYSLCIGISYITGRKLFGGYAAALTESVRAREELLAETAAHGRELQAVSGEISHELKNPLATIRGLVELMALDAPTERNAERLAVLQRETVRMQSSIEELLNLARPLSPLELGLVDLARVCQEVCALHEGVAEAAGLTLEVRRARLAAHADERKLKQILMNLLQNAIDASPRGGVVTVSVHDEGDRAALVVADAGHGLDPELGARLFEPGVTTKERGAGLGLTIARSLARQHGGDLVLCARAPRGCEARVTLPRRSAEVKEAA
jgi:signal transduction histidine kinase